MELKTRLSPLRGKSRLNIDFQNDVIRDVVIVQEGLAKGHGAWVDAKFVKQIARQGNAKGTIKSRFGHPNMCNNSLGDFIGVYSNFSTREVDGKTQALADLHLDRKVADKSPKYDKSIVDYILNFANENPDMFGNSIVFSATLEDRQVKENGEKIKKTFFVLSENGFTASDIVDDPAATDGLFSEYNIAAQITEFLAVNDFDFDQFEQVLENESFVKFVDMLLSNHKISHRILSMIANNKTAYGQFKENILSNQDQELDINRVTEMLDDKY